jgi:hypothetical protein
MEFIRSPLPSSVLGPHNFVNAIKNMTPSIFVCRYRQFGEFFCLHLQDKTQIYTAHPGCTTVHSSRLEKYLVNIVTYSCTLPVLCHCTTFEAIYS